MVLLVVVVIYAVLNLYFLQKLSSHKMNESYTGDNNVDYFFYDDESKAVMSYRFSLNNINGTKYRTTPISWYGAHSSSSDLVLDMSQSPTVTVESTGKNFPAKWRGSELLVNMGNKTYVMTNTYAYCKKQNLNLIGVKC